MVGVGLTALTGWQMFQFPLTETWMTGLNKTEASAGRPGGIYKATFNVDSPADTYLDMSRWTKGMVWVNGRKAAVHFGGYLPFAAEIGRLLRPASVIVSSGPAKKETI